MVRTKEELLKMVNGIIGDNTSDEAIQLLEDVTDTLNDYDTRISPDGIDWKKKYDDNDSAWRKKYKERFSHPVTVDTVTQDTQTNDINTQLDEQVKPLEYEALFKTEETK